MRQRHGSSFKAIKKRESVAKRRKLVHTRSLNEFSFDISAAFRGKLNLVSPAGKMGSRYSESE